MPKDCNRCTLSPANTPHGKLGKWFEYRHPQENIYICFGAGLQISNEK